MKLSDTALILIALGALVVYQEQKSGLVATEPTTTEGNKTFNFIRQYWPF